MRYVDNTMLFWENSVKAEMINELNQESVKVTSRINAENINTMFNEDAPAEEMKTGSNSPTVISEMKYLSKTTTKTRMKCHTLSHCHTGKLKLGKDASLYHNNNLDLK